MEIGAALTLATSIVLALAGYLFAYLNNLRLAQRTAQLDRVNRQLRELYGPLLASCEASSRAWDVFRSHHRTAGVYWSSVRPPSEAEAKTWRLWVTTVFMPINERLAELVTNYSDLIEEQEMPECLIELYAHVAGYRPVIEAWQSGDFSEHTSPLNFPRDPLVEYARSRYQLLKKSQARLLGRRAA
jgi:hypothetical protein